MCLHTPGTASHLVCLRRTQYVLKALLPAALVTHVCTPFGRIHLLQTQIEKAKDTKQGTALQLAADSAGTGESETLYREPQQDKNRTRSHESPQHLSPPPEKKQKQTLQHQHTYTQHIRNFTNLTPSVIARDSLLLAWAMVLQGRCQGGPAAVAAVVETRLCPSLHSAWLFGEGVLELRV